MWKRSMRNHFHYGGSCIHPCGSCTCHCHDYGDACCHDDGCGCGGCCTFHACGIQNSHYHHNGNTCETIPSYACQSVSSSCFQPVSSCSPRWQPCHKEIDMWGHRPQIVADSVHHSIFEELLFPLGISINFIRCITRQIVELLNIFSHDAVALLQIMEFLLLHAHHSG